MKLRSSAGHLQMATMIGLMLVTLGGCARVISGYHDMQGKVTATTRDQGAAAVATLPLIIDGDQLLTALELEKPVGGSRKVLALINMGQSRPWLKQSLYSELEIDRGRNLILHIGGLTMNVEASAVQVEPDRRELERQFGTFFPAHRIEMVLQAGVLAKYELVLDYLDKKLTLAAPGHLHPQGIAVPISLNPETGLVTVAAVVDGAPHHFVIDCGSPYSWVRGSAAQAWVKAHPSWKRTDGAVGLSNYNMLDNAFEKDGIVVRIPSISLGALELKEVGLLGTGALLGFGDHLFGELFWDAWQENAAVPVAGWFGNNILKQYRITIDYPNRMSYWLKRGEPDPSELDQVGLTLVYNAGVYAIGGIVGRNGQPTAEGLMAGDRLLQIDGQRIDGWPRERVLAALHGRPGESRSLVVERNGGMIERTTMVSAF